MDIKLLLTCIALSSCGTQTAPQETFDRMDIITYKNTYSEDDKLLNVQTINMRYVYENGLNMVPVMIDTCTSDYKYINDVDYVIEEDFKFLGEKKITKYIGNTEEVLIRDEKKDTVSYSFLRYYDSNKSQLAYARNISKSNYSTNGNYEEEREYDKDGNNIKRVRYYFDTKKKELTYTFEHMLYDEAIKKIPRMDDECKIICYTENMVGDTIVKQKAINGILESLEKVIIEGDKKTQLWYSNDMKLIESSMQLKKDGFDIITRHSLANNWTDSTFYRGGKEIRHVYLSDKYKQVTVSKYDENGNIIEKIDKTKDVKPQDDKELINDMLEMLRESNVNEK